MREGTRKAAVGFLLGFIATVTIATARAGQSADFPQRLFSADVAHRLDATISAIMRSNNLPSVAVEAAIPGKGRYVFVGGIANLQTGAPRQFSQSFRIASITKSFVATAVLQLVDKARLQKTDPMAKWFPDFPNADRITVDDLLRMRSGIAAPTDQQVMEAVYDNPTAPAPTLAEMMAQSAALRSQFKPPNAEGVYTNLNYYILDGIVQQVTGQDVGVLITNDIIRPLHLRHTSYPRDTKLPGGLHGYGWDPQTSRFSDKTALNPAIGGAAGAMVSSVADLTRYVRALCRGGLLKSATEQARLQGQRLAGTGADYGEGLIVGPDVCGHGGTAPGFSTEMYYLGHIDATLVISVNRLDRDDNLQTTPVLKAVVAALRAQLGDP